MFKEWLILNESFEDRQMFIDIVKKYYPEAKFRAVRELSMNDTVPVFVDISTSDKKIDLNWNAASSVGNGSNVYINIKNSGFNSYQKYAAAQTLQKNSLNFVKHFKKMIEEFTNSGMIVSYIPSDLKRTKVFSKEMVKMGGTRIMPTHEDPEWYWKKSETL